MVELIDPFDLSDPTDYPAEMRRMRDEIERLRKENEELKHDLERAIANHTADISEQ